MTVCGSPTSTGRFDSNSASKSQAGDQKTPKYNNNNNNNNNNNDSNNNSNDAYNDNDDNNDDNNNNNDMLITISILLIAIIMIIYCRGRRVWLFGQKRRSFYASTFLLAWAPLCFYAHERF